MAAQVIDGLGIELWANVARFKTDMNKASEITQQTVGKITSSVGKLGSVFAGVSAAFAFGSIIREASQAEHAFAQLEAGVRSTGGAAGYTARQLSDMAGALQKVSRYDDDAIAGAESLLLTFTRIGHDVFPKATQAVLDLSTKLGGDLNSAAIQIGKALNDPIKGITALQRVGVSFSESQKDMIKNMIKVGDIAGAQTLILKELSVEMGGAAEAARHTLGGSIEAVQHSFDNLLEALGTSQSSGLQKIFNTTADAIDNVAEHADELSNAILAVAAAAGVLAAARLPATIEGIIASLGTLGLRLGALGGIATVGVATAVGALVYFRDTAIDLGDDTVTITSLIQAAWEETGELIGNVMKEGGKHFKYLGDQMKALSDFMAGFGDTVFTAFITPFNQAMEVLRQFGVAVPKVPEALNQFGAGFGVGVKAIPHRAAGIAAGQFGGSAFDALSGDVALPRSGAGGFDPADLLKAAKAKKIKELKDHFDIGPSEEDLAKMMRDKLGKGFEDAINFQQELLDQDQEYRNKQLEKAKQYIESVKTEQEKWQDTLRELKKLLDDGSLTQEKYNRLVNELSPAYKQLQKDKEKAKDVIASLRTEQEKLNDQMRELNSLLSKDLITQDQYNKSMTKLQQQLLNLNPAFKSFKDAAHEIGSAFGTAFDSLALKGGKWSDVLKQLALDLGKIAEKHLLLDPLQKLFDNLLNKAGQGIFGGGGITGGGTGLAGGAGILGGLTKLFPGLGGLFGGPKLPGVAPPIAGSPAQAPASTGAISGGAFSGLLQSAGAALGGGLGPLAAAPLLDPFLSMLNSNWGSQPSKQVATVGAASAGGGAGGSGWFPSNPTQAGAYRDQLMAQEAQQVLNDPWASPLSKSIATYTGKGYGVPAFNFAPTPPAGHFRGGPIFSGGGGGGGYEPTDQEMNIAREHHNQDIRWQQNSPTFMGRYGGPDHGGTVQQFGNIYDRASGVINYGGKTFGSTGYSDGRWGAQPISWNWSTGDGTEELDGGVFEAQKYRRSLVPPAFGIPSPTPQELNWNDVPGKGDMINLRPDWMHRSKGLPNDGLIVDGPPLWWGMERGLSTGMGGLRRLDEMDGLSINGQPLGGVSYPGLGNLLKGPMDFLNGAYQFGHDLGNIWSVPQWKLSNLDYYINTGLMHFASGGRPPLGRPSIVGERGPEMFVPDVAGKIVPTHELNRGGGDMVVNIQNHAGVDIQPRVVDSPTGRSLEVLVQDTVNKVVSGGGLDQTMGQRFGNKPRGRF